MLVGVALRLSDGLGERTGGFGVRSAGRAGFCLVNRWLAVRNRHLAIEHHAQPMIQPPAFEPRPVKVLDVKHSR